MKDAGPWAFFVEIVRGRGLESVTITKVKGHATQQMVDAGKVEGREKSKGMAKQTRQQGSRRRSSKKPRGGEIVCRIARIEAWALQKVHGQNPTVPSCIKKGREESEARG